MKLRKISLMLKVFIEVYSEGKSGLINSDWHVLKFSGYKKSYEGLGTTFLRSC